ncbi:flavin-containing monooxygenase [Haliangium ochraceum]|uniref:Monooxygenase flavin-binding family protein n=1 Tax=Haliangium ochraceum (strain DSM 14365 / JCM 11303 / SMP-2) TaxID=502025 RepID=D0LY35_HALO1|nr:NAD(P)/FAD-dependent oxidoreductase [Haliangium ochraceum]ACY14390.1 monooxygenase flavin-binding family protein [Haliangium ochraceum DSM 14365]
MNAPGTGSADAASENQAERADAAADEFDVVIVGAGLSGVGAAYRISTECPEKSYAVFEARDAIGGTWDLFRYPGVRSDSDMFTLGYPFHPWGDTRAIADGGAIRDYIRDTAERFEIAPHIRYRHRVRSASWSSSENRWLLEVELTVGARGQIGQGEAEGAGELRRYRCRFLYLCSGYYRYDRAHDPHLPGIDNFAGEIVHPQWWPEELDYAGKRVVVVGSGATAVTLVPAMAESAARVTMLQRSPSYVTSLPGEDRIAAALRAVLPASLAHRLMRGKNVLFGMLFYLYCRRHPARARRFLRRRMASALPADFPIDTHFQPRYDPWDQRLCVVPDGDLFAALSEGRADIVTDTIETFTADGIRLRSGAELSADIVVTATGLELLSFGGIALDVDGRRIEPGDTLVYKGLMLSQVPNLAWCVGYINASWTLRADLASRYVCRLLRFMDRHGYQRATPRLDDDDGQRRPLLDLSSSYIARAVDALPKQGTRAPWFLRQNYFADLATMRLGCVNDAAMRFDRGAAS